MLFSSTDPLTTDCYFHYSDEDGTTITNKPTPNRDSNSNCSHSDTAAKPEQTSVEIDSDVRELLDVVPRLSDAFHVDRKIGTGTFSSVYLAWLKGRPKAPQFALKHIIPTSHPSRIESELRCLQDIGGQDNVMGVSACLREKDHVIIVMPYFPHDKFQEYVRNMSVAEIRDYMWNLLLALRHVHRANIIHRDIKPSNFLYNRKLKKYALVDFGLAQQAPGSRKKTASCGMPMSRSLAKNETSNKVSNCSTKTSDDVKVKPFAALSPKSKSRRCKLTDTQLSSPSKKRKINTDDIENQHQSPRKRRHQSEMHRRLTEISHKANSNSLIDKPCKHTEKPPGACLQNLNLNTMTLQPDPLKGGCRKIVRSPRRIVLTRRTLDLTDKCATMDPTGKLSTPSGSLQTTKLLPPSVSTVTRTVAHRSRHVANPVAPSVCQCYGQPMICSICMARSVQKAPRAGTPGFRSPEVLMRWPDQTTAVDIWSAGVIFLSLLSGRYPFFKANDDMMALAQITSIIGSEEMKTAAAAYGKNLTVNPPVPPLNPKSMCEKLRGVKKPCSPGKRSGQKDSCHGNGVEPIPDTAYDLLKELLNPNPVTRITASDALDHPFFGGIKTEVAS